jgi:hypothetical protein
MDTRIRAGALAAALLSASVLPTMSQEAPEKPVREVPNRQADDSGRVPFVRTIIVTIEEDNPFAPDYGPAILYSRAGGPALGAKIAATRPGALSRFRASALYHAGNGRLTFFSSIGQRFLGDALAFGISFRRAFESNMDWAVMPAERSWNAFLSGAELVNLFQVQGASLSLSYRFGETGRIGASYFDETFSSLGKNTNWALFDWGDKRPNAALSPDSRGRLTGVRYAAGFARMSPTRHTLMQVEIEQATGASLDVTEYTRYFAAFRFGQLGPWGTAFLARAAGGWADRDLPDQRAFRLGGLNTLRGYGPGELPEPPAGLDGFGYAGGGNRMALLNLEYLVGVRPYFAASLFGDTGAAWRRRDAVQFADFRTDLGLGLALSPFYLPADAIFYRHIGMVRLNWAIPVGDTPHRSRWSVNFIQPF